MEKQDCLWQVLHSLTFFLRQIENKWTAASLIPEYSWAAPAPWALGQATLPRSSCLSSQDTVLVEWVSSCCISLFSVSLQCYLRALADSVVPAQSSWVCCTSKTFWLSGGSEKILLSPRYDAARQPVAGEGAVHSHFLRIFHELSTVRPSQYLHVKAWHDKRMKSLGISPLSLNLFISSWAKVRTNSSNTRHSVQCRNG